MVALIEGDLDEADEKAETRSPTPDCGFTQGAKVTAVQGRLHRHEAALNP
jgi:hypothetical protein